MPTITKPTSRRKSACDMKFASRLLEQNGWSRAVAGDHDFNLACRALCEMISDRTKGIVVMGNVGVGKTFLADILYHYVGGNKAKIECADDGQVDLLVSTGEASQNGGRGSSSADDLLDMTVFIDDLGAETIRNVYGNVFDRCGRFLAKYYSHGTKRLIVTTNLDGAGIDRRYGARILDRLADRCVMVKFSGTSKRERMAFT